MKHTNRIFRHGFTLIELMVVITVIGILASVVLVSMSGSRPKARDARRYSDLRQISPAMESVTNDDYLYPTAVGPVMPAIKNIAGHQYLAPLVDPLNDSEYKYIWVTNSGTGLCGGLREGQYFCAIAKLEIKGSCAAAENHYFIVNPTGQKDVCSSADYVQTQPGVCDCIGL